MSEKIGAAAPLNVWQQAIDAELVSAHLGVAPNDATFEGAQKAIHELICWHIDVATTEGATNEVTVLPDGSAFAVYSYPLPKGHWLYAPREYEQGAEEPKELAAPILTHEAREQVISAIRYAVRGATDCGKETDFDPDALVQNAVYALCGPFNKNQPQPQADALDAERWRFIKRKLCLTGNGDGTCAMQALNLPARITGWPDVGELAITQFVDAAIDAAIAAAKENK